MSILINHCTIVTMNQRDEIIEDGALVYDDEKISYVGDYKSSNLEQFEEVIDGSGYIVLPGLINAHNHSMSHILKTRFINVPLEIWRQYVKSGWSLLDAKGIYLDVLWGALELLKNGVTTTIDHFTNLLPKNNEGITAAYKAIIDSGIRGALAPMLSDVNYEKTIPIEQYLKSDEAKKVVKGISSSENAGIDEVMNGFLKEFINKNPRFHCMLGPAAPQRCSKELLMKVKGLAKESDTGIHMHVLETKSQYYQCKKAFNNRSAIQYLQDIGFLDERVGMAHVIWVDEKDLDIIAGTGASVAHNPVSNLRLGDGVAPIIKMLHKGINIAIATDGPCSNDGQNLLESLKTGSIMHNVHEDNFKDWIDPKESLKMITINAAKTLSLDKIIGSIEIGKRADFTIFNKYSYPYIPKGDLYSQIVLCETGRNIERVIVNGKTVINKGINLFMDEAKVAGEVQAYTDGISEGLKQKQDETRILEPVLEEMYFSHKAPKLW